MIEIKGNQIFSMERYVSFPTIQGVKEYEDSIATYIFRD